MPRIDSSQSTRVTSPRPRPVHFLALAVLAAACSREPLAASGGDETPEGADPTAGQGTPTVSPSTTVAAPVAAPTPSQTPTEEEWRTTMARTPLPNDGCFQASYPGNWQAVPCVTPPNVPFGPTTGLQAGGPHTVGNGSDLSSQVTGTIAWAEGSFPIVTGVTSVTDGTPDNFSLQVNTNFFNTMACSGGALNCRGWQQFLYAPGFTFIQYWLLNFGNSCPAGWNTTPLSPGNCFKNSTGSVTTPVLSATNLAHLVLTGTAGGSDTVVTSNGVDLFGYSQASVLGLNSGWNAAEFNLFGRDGSAPLATFNAGSTVVVRTVTNSAPTTTNAPSCLGTGFTFETNNLSIVPGSCCPIGGAAPGIQFTQSNVAGATAQACPFSLQTAVVCGRSATGIRCARSNGTSFDEVSRWSPDFTDALWNVPQNYLTIQYPDVDGDGLSDVCGRRQAGVACGPLVDGTGTAAPVWSSFFSDANGWAFTTYYSTIRFPDVNGDGKADVCGRYSDGIRCGLSTGTGFGAVSIWQSSFSDAAGWTPPEYDSTISFPDVNGDGKADVCARGGTGIKCALSNGTSFGTLTSWASIFSDANGWNEHQYYSTIKFPDLNGDGKADVCGRGGSGIKCALSSGTSFGSVGTWASLFSDASGWDQPQYYSTITYGDLNGDGKADVCGRGGTAYKCARSSGSTFGSPTTWQSSLTDANGWDAIESYTTLRLVDVNHDGKVDVCGRSGLDGIKCAKSNGSTFGSLTTWSSFFTNSGGWNTEPRYSTISFPHK